MEKRIVSIIYIILLVAVLLTTGSCDRHRAAWEKLDMAESLMDSKPDSALEVLESIPASNVKGKEVGLAGI